MSLHVLLCAVICASLHSFSDDSCVVRGEANSSEVCSSNNLYLQCTYMNIGFKLRHSANTLGPHIYKVQLFN